MKEIKRQLYMRWEEIMIYAILEIGFFLFGEVLLWIVVYLVGEKQSIIQAGTAMAVFVPMFVMNFAGMNSLPLHFNTAVSLGATRRRTVPAILGATLVIDLAAVWSAALFYHLEKWIFRIAYAGFPVEDDLGFLFQWKYIFPVCLAIVALNGLFGALFLRVGKAAFTVFWILWIVVFIGIPRLGHWIQSGQDNAFLRVCRKAVDMVFGFSEMGILAGVVAVSAVVIFVSWMLLRRQQVEI